MSRLQGNTPRHMQLMSPHKHDACCVQLAVQGIPLIKECDELSCDTRTIVIWVITAIALCVVFFCLLWNVYIHWRASRATEVPAFLRSIRKQQAKYKEMKIKVAPAKPDFMLDMQAKKEMEKAREQRNQLEEKANKDLKKEINELESRIQRKRVHPPFKLVF
jgi:biopolymer transport protein ExbB/TolQ